MTTELVNRQAMVLSVGDTTYLDYGAILEKREGYGPQGNGGNGLYQFSIYLLIHTTSGSWPLLILVAKHSLTC